MRISDWRSDVCSSDLGPFCCGNRVGDGLMRRVVVTGLGLVTPRGSDVETVWGNILASKSGAGTIERFDRSEEHTSELQSLMRISSAVFCLEKKKRKQT